MLGDYGGDVGLGGVLIDTEHPEKIAPAASDRVRSAASLIDFLHPCRRTPEKRKPRPFHP